MAEKKSWRDYSKSSTTEKSSTSGKTGTWRDYSNITSTTKANDKSTGSWRDYSTVDTASIVGNNVVNRVNNWLTNHNAYIKGYQDRYAGRKGGLEDDYVSDSGDWLNTVKNQYGQYGTEANEILAYVDQYKDYLDEDWVKSVKDTIANARYQQYQILDSSTKDNEYWNSFNTEELVSSYGSAEEAYKYFQRSDGYNKTYTGKTTSELDEIIANLDDGEEKDWLNSYRASVELDEMGKADLAAGQKEIEKLEWVSEEMAKISTQYFYATNSAGMYTEEEADEIRNQYHQMVKKWGTPAEFDAMLAKKKQYWEQAKYIQDLNTFSAVTGNEDFEQNSQYVSNVEYGLFGKPEFDDKTYAYVNNPTVEDKRPLGAGTITARELIESIDDIYKSDTALRNTESSYEKDALDYIKEDEVKIYNYYYATEGKEKADEYLDLLVKTFKERKYAEAFEKAYKFGSEHRFWGSVLSVGTSLGSGFEYIEDVIQYGADKLAGKDATLDKNELAMTTNAIRGGVADTVDWEIKGWDAFDFLYNTTMSGIDSLASTAFGKAGGVVLGLSAAAQGTNDAIERGMSDGQAFWTGLTSGVFEGLFESVSIGRFNKLKEVAPKNFKDIAKNLAKSMLVNASEETATEIANILYDTIANGEFANYTMEELQNGAWKQALGQVLEAGASGALMGLGMGAVGSTIGNTKANIKAKAEYGDKTDTLINQGLQNDVDSKSHQLATKYQQKVEGKDGKKGKALTGQQIRNLLAANQDAITSKDMQKIQQAAEKRLTELGQTGDVAKVAELAAKFATGQKLTRAEKSLLANSQYGSRVASELLPQNVFAGLDSSAWAQDIGTESVNAAAYNKKAIRNLIDAIANAEDTTAYKSLEDRAGKETTFKVSEDGQDTIRGENKATDLSDVEITEFIKDKKGNIVDMVLKTDGKEVKASEIDYADNDKAYLFEAVSKIENISPRTATTIVRDYDPSSGQSVGEYLNGIDEAYTYGYHGYNEADLNAGNFAPKLTETQMKSAYVLGQEAKKARDTAKADNFKRMRTAMEAEAEKTTEKGKEAPKAKKMTITYNDGKGNVVDFDKAGVKLTTKQKAAPAIAKIMQEMGLGTNFELFSSYVNKDGVRVFRDENGVERKAYSGMYRMSDGTVRIDLNAYNGRGLTLNAMAHELTHFIQQWSTDKYNALADFLVKTYEKTDMSMHDRVVREQNRLESIRGEKVSYNEAYDEVVANAMSKMLDDGNVMERLNELMEVDMNLAQKLWEGLKKLLNKFFNVYKNESALFYDAADLMDLKAEFEQMQKMWADAFAEASENFQTKLTASETQTITEAGIGFDEDTQSVYSLHFSTAYNDTIQVGKKTFDTEAIAQVVAKGTSRSIEDARKWVQSELTIANIVMQNPEFLDFDADNRYEAIKKNSDYPQGTVDLSNLCPKREEFTAMFDMLQKKYPNKLFTAQDVADMRKILSDNDITVACGACFVEDRRQLIGEIADTYIQMWKEAVETGKPLQKTNAAGQKADLLVTKALAKQYGLTPGTKIMATDTYIPNQYDLTTYEGFKKLEKNHPTIAMGFNRYNNSRGQQSARLIEGRAEYNRQILGWSDAKVRSVNNNGGLRIFSFSDFEVVHLLDLVQVIIDCSARGVKIQGYTKIPAFAKLVRDTGVKLNRSLIPSGDYGFHMENGKVVLDYDTTEGIDINDKNFIDESDNPNVGNIVIGINPTQIGAAMHDPFIDYIIPFHSNKAKEILRKLGTGEWVNYKESQHEKDISTGKASKHNVNIYTEVINKYHPTNKVEFVNAFLKECKRQGKTPRYAEFLNVDENGDYAYREGYHKLLVDFKMFDKDGNILPQGDITPNLDENFMKELLNAEIDRKQNYEFPQEVYDAIDEKFGEQYSSQETDIEGYDTTNLAWAIESGIITEADQARFWEAIAEIQKMKYNSFARTKNGAYIIETTNTMMFTDGDYKAPTLSKVIVFPYGEFVDTSEERTMIRNEARTTGRTNRSTEIIEKLYGPGFVTEYYTPHYRSDGREIGQREGAHSGGIASKSRGRGVRHGETDGLQSGQKVNRDFLADDNLKGNYTVSEISEMFDVWNSDPELADLSKKVFAKLQEMMNEQEKAYWATPYPIRFKSDAYLQKAYYIAPNGIFEPSQTDGDYGITYNLDYFRKTSDQDKARVLLHEAIHACTVGAIKSAERRIPKYADPMEFTPDDSWSDAQKASLELIQVFAQVRVANERNEYGQKNVYEMVAEMANPEFREMLKKQNLWGRIVDAIKRIFGIEPRTAYDAVSNALEKILELDIQKANGEVYSTQETDNISNRDLLANAFESISKSSEEYKMIQEYKGMVSTLNRLDKDLAEINAEIRKIRFGTEGARDMEALRKLEEKAQRIARDINKNDKRLLNMEASEPLRKVIERERKKEAQKTKEHVKEIQQNKKARAEQTELRHKIRKAVRDLNKILNRGNKKQNVKEDMQGFVSKALELADYLFTDHISNDDLIRKGITVRMTPKEAALVKETEDILSQLYDHADSLTDEEFTRLDAKRKANEDKLRDLLTAQRNERLNTPVYNLFNDLVTEYASLKNSNQEAVKGAYDPKVEEFLRSYLGENADGTDADRKTLLQNMRVADMTTEELWKLYNAYTMVLHSVRKANELFVKGKTESIEQMAGRIMSDFSKRKAPEGKVATVIRNLSNKMGWDYEKLYYALDRIGSEAFTELVMNLADAENTVMQDIMEAVAFRDEIVKKYDFNNWAVNKEIDKEFLDNTGKKFKLTLGQLMSLYAYSRREGAWDHIEYGGFVFGEAALTNPKPADSYKLSKAQCEAITNTLTKEQKGYVEDMQKFLSETMGAKGNEVSMLLYGIKMFGEKNYFPIHIAGQFKAQANESQAKAAAGFSSMTNAGFTHAQNPNAKAPFVLEGFNEIWADHVNEMSRYHGTVPALEDMRRVMNRSSYSEAESESMAIKQLMENSFGKEAVEYFDNLYREANSGAITDKMQRKSKKLLSLFRKNSVAYSLSVVIQQPSAMARAYAMIDKKYFGFKGVGALTSGIAKAVSSKWNPAYANAYNEMRKYAPGVTMAKEIGGFDTHTGSSIREYLLDTGKSFKQSMKTENLLGKGKAVLDLVDDNAIANLPSVADKIAWIEIWNACKRETVAKHKDLATNSEEFMQAVGERFTEVIRATQVYDSIFAKSPLLKSKYIGVQYLVSFMNEPNTTANMAEKAVRDATKGDWKGGLRIAGAVTYSIIFNNVLKAIVYAMRDDDEDETYIEKYLAAVAGGMMDDFNPISYIPIARDAWSKARGYDVERPDVAIISDAIEAFQAIGKLKDKDTEGMTDAQIAELDKKMTESSWKLVGSLAAFFGIPVKNIYREIEGVIDHARIASANAGMTTASGIWDKVKDEVIDSIPFLTSENTKTDKLYDAIVSGDTKYLERMKGTYKTEDAYQSAVRKALRENDPRIREAAQARYDGNTEEYKRIFREIKNEGKFSFDDIMSAVNSEVSKIRNGLEPEKATSDYTANGYVEAIAMGNATEAQAMKDDIISAKVANGKTQAEAEKEFKSAVATGIGEAYSSGLLDETQAEKMLMEYAGKDEEEASSKVGYWSFLDAHPEYEQYDLSESNVGDYLEFAEPADISVDVYAQFINGTKGLESIKDEWGDVEKSVRDQTLEVIDSLPLTWEQKDALYLAAGYSESKIWDVPW